MKLYWIVGVIGALLIFEAYVKIRKGKKEKKSETKHEKSYIVDLTIDIENKK